MRVFIGITNVDPCTYKNIRTMFYKNKIELYLCRIPSYMFNINLIFSNLQISLEEKGPKLAPNIICSW